VRERRREPLAGTRPQREGGVERGVVVEERGVEQRERVEVARAGAPRRGTQGRRPP